MNETCNTLNDCEFCIANGCMWCGNVSKCHDKYSPYGCVVSSPCMDMMECKRKQPIKIGFSKLNPIVVSLGIIVCIVVLISIWSIWYFIYKHKQPQIRQENNDMELELESYYNRLNNNDHNLLSPISDKSNHSKNNNSDNNDTLNTSFNSIDYNEKNDDHSIDKEHLLFSEKDIDPSNINVNVRSNINQKHNICCNNNKTIKCTFICAIVCTILVVLFTIIFMILYPSVPKYSICNTEFEWWSIWSSLKEGSLATKYDVLLTLRNDNYFGIELNNGGLRIYHDNSLIGTYYQDQQIKLKSHSLNDYIIEVTFSPALSQAYTIYNLFENNNLNIEIDMFGDVKGYLLDNKNLQIFNVRLAYNVNNLFIGKDINDTSIADCNCKL